MAQNSQQNTKKNLQQNIEKNSQQHTEQDSQQHTEQNSQKQAEQSREKKAIKQGQAALHRTVQSLPQEPGIYAFLDEQGTILYIGKSMHLKQRVSSYFYQGEKHPKIERMLRWARQLKYQVCDTHLEARLLECAEIKRHKPPYNSQYKKERRFTTYSLAQAETHLLRRVSNNVQSPLFQIPRSFLVDEGITTMERLYPIKLGQTKLHYHIMPKRLKPAEQQATLRFLLELFSSRDVFRNFELQVEALMQDFARDLAFERAEEMKRLGSALRYLRYWCFDYQKTFWGTSYYEIPSIHGTKGFVLEGAKIIASVEDGKLKPFQMEQLTINHAYDNQMILYTEFRDQSLEGHLSCSLPKPDFLL